MMRAAGRIVPAIAALVLVLTYLLVRSAAPDGARHERMLDAFRILLLDNAALHRDVLRARSGLLHNYDPLVRSLDGLRTAIADLRSADDAAPDNGRDAIDRQIESLAAAVGEQEALIEAFKSNNALLQNSLSYITHASHQLSLPARHRQDGTAAAIGVLANSMLRFRADPSQDTAADVEAALDRLALLSLPEPDRKDVAAVVAHARLIVASLPRVDDVVARLLATPTDERVRALQDTYLDYHGRFAARAGTFRVLLYIAAVVLAAYLAYLFARLRISARTLRRRLAFENTVAQISTQFIALPRERMADGIGQGLARLAEGAGMDRAYILLRDGTGIDSAYRWPRGTGSTAATEGDGALLAFALGGTFGDHERQGCLYIPAVGALPPTPGRTWLADRGIRSWICVPLQRGSARIGLLGLDATRDDRRYADDDLALLRMAGEIFANAIGRELDESQREALAARLRQTQRVEAIGTLAGGIAHNFNNILGAILGYAEMAIARLPEGSRPRHHVQEVMKAGNRAKGIIDQILTFSRRGERRRQRVPMRALLDETVVLLRATLPSTIEIRAAATNADAGVMGDATQLQQMLVNLCTNAAQAMDGRGVVDLTLDTVTLSDAKVLSHGTVPPGRHVRLCVADSGHGMDRPTIERIFEPFFTTRAPGGGTGLGLAMVHGIVADHGGVLDVRSQPGAGSAFDVYLAQADSADMHPPASDAAAPTGQGETILLVDDERSLVLLGEEMLAMLGYEPVGFDSSRAALAAFTADPKRFDLVLADEVMPEMTGSELAAAIHRLRPEIPIILMTGFAMPSNGEKYRTADFCALLRKPLSSRDIARALARHLPARPPAA